MSGWPQFAVGGEEELFLCWFIFFFCCCCVFLFFPLPLFFELARVLMEKNFMPHYIVVKLLAFLIYFSCYFLFLVFMYCFFELVYIFIKYLWSLLMESAGKSDTTPNIFKCLCGK